MNHAVSNQATSTREPLIVVVGSTQSGRATVAWFDKSTATQAKDIAGRRGFQVVQLMTDGQKQLAGTLPHGRVRKDGQLHMGPAPASLRNLLSQLAPTTSGAVAEQSLAELPRRGEAHGVGAAATPTSEFAAAGSLPAKPGGVGSAGTVPHDFDEIAPGSIVLARDDEAEAWYEAIVLMVQDDRYQLRWRDYPRERQLHRKRDQLALLYPKVA